MELQVEPSRYTPSDLRRTIQNLELMWHWLPGDGTAPALGAERAQVDEVLARFPTAQSLSVATRADLEAAVLAGMTALHHAGRRLVAAGLAPPPSTGRVAQLNASGGGVPKLPVEHVDVNWRGLVGDRQATRVHHGRPWQALCLWSMEVIEQLRADGHPISAGAAGENITLVGLDWASVRTGVQVQVGDVVCEISAPALPCSKNRRWFLGGDVGAMHHDRGPVSRAYATVVRPGTIAQGDEALLGF
ncbi:MAG: hypothetical protein JWL70_378 [Acidimicrobiia bacterium]|nr:hypothetical protein [Acidimicrobiia bacterium]